MKELLHSEVFTAISEFLILFLILLFISMLLNKKRKDFSKLKGNDEVRTFVLKYDIDVRKIDYKKLLNVLAIIKSFILSFTAIIIVRIKSPIWTILAGIVMVAILIMALYPIAGHYFKSHEKEIVIEDKIEEVIKESKKKKTKKKEGKK